MTVLEHAPSPESLFERIEPLLARVSKPVQYVGGELNSVVKEWASTEVRWCLSYPDAYEIGLPNQGVAILYEVLNERDWILAERTYAVWGDMEALMREHGVPQFTLDGHRAVGAFDVFGLSFATELGYTNMLTELDLAGIPLRAVDRREHDPIVLAGGHAAFNPEPIADFVDAAVLGDGEEIALAISEVVREWKTEGRPDGRDGLLMRLAASGGVYVPKFYDTDYLPDGRIRRIAPDRSGVPVHGPQAHADGPRRLALPAQAAGADGRDRCTSATRWRSFGAAARLPLLPGRDDHPPGPRAQPRDDRQHGRGRHRGDRAGGGRAAQPVQRGPLRDRRGRAPAPPTATTARTSRSRSPAPASTRSTSTWPTSCRATGDVPG